MKFKTIFLGAVLVQSVWGAIEIVDTTADESIAIDKDHYSQKEDFNKSLLTNPYPYVQPTVVEKAPPRQKISEPTTTDSDGDGVFDSDDRCADTPVGIAVDLVGCALDEDIDGVADYKDRCPKTPADVAVDLNGCPLDSDKDGVADYLDECADTQEGLSVNEKGCPKDDDQDGVPNYLDECRDTPLGFHVDKKGCELTANLNIHFQKASGVIRKEDLPKVKVFADFLIKNPRFKVVIIGHTDNIGSTKSNQKLSEIRALSVKNALVKQFHIDPKRLKTLGKGESDPIATNLLESGREQNRRIEIQLTH